MSDSTEAVILSAGGVTILILLSLFGNILVCFAVCYSKKLRGRVNYLIISLAIADIMIAVISMPIWIYSEITGFRNLSAEKTLKLVQFWTYIDILGGISSISNLTVISYERLWSVCSPFSHRRYLNNLFLTVLIIIAWLFAIVIASTSIAYIHEKWFVLYTATLGFFIPLFFITIAYLIIFVIVNRRSRNVLSSQDNSRVTVTICIIVGVFFLCWAPHFFASVLSIYCESCHIFLIENLWFRSLSTWLHYANSCVNPIIYGLGNAQYKEAFKTVLRKICTMSLPKPSINNNNVNGNRQSTALLRAPLFQEDQNDHVEQKEKELRVDLGEKEDKDRGEEMDNNFIEYLQGDYRALPEFRSNRDIDRSRWNSGRTSSTYTSGSNYDDCTSLQVMLITPEPATRTSHL